MARLGFRTRAVAAWLVVVSLLAPGSLGARMGCDVCPPDCPMHRTVAEPETHDMPCHRVAETADAAQAGAMLRAACGHAERGDLVVHLRYRDPAALPSFPLASPPPPLREPRAPAARVADVPVRPPRDGRSS